MNVMNNDKLIFNNVSFIVKDKNNLEKVILDNISGNVSSGEMLGILGPSGAGKTTLLNVLTHNTNSGKSFGKILYNNSEISSRFLMEECYIVNQQDFHWPFLTCRETIEYSINLYKKSNSIDETNNLTDDILKKLGLESCQNTKVGNEFFKGLSGGQKRRLSIAIALVKKSKIIFLDEPTSGLDAAAASKIMNEINILSKELNLIILTTIHQPSSKIFFEFDKVMILSEGKLAYSDNPKNCIKYLYNLGKTIPDFYNPAEYFLDLVNSDFETRENVDFILNSWVNEEQEVENSNFKIEFKEKDVDWHLNNIKIMFNRQFYLAYKDPIIYISRATIFLITNIYFALVYYQSRFRHQDQILNRMWLTVWFIGVPANMGVVTVYACNNEFNSIIKEVKNGMVSLSSYLISKTLLEIPIMFLFGIIALGPSAYGISNYYAPNMMIFVSIWSLCLYCWESIAQVMSLSFKNPLLGMMSFMGVWFSSFLYGGFLIPGEDMIWPFKIFYYILPLKYSIRSMIYTEFIDSKYDNCNKKRYEDELCFGKKGKEVLENMNTIYPLFSSDNTLRNDLLIVFGLTLFFKLLYFVLLLKSNKSSKLIKNKYIKK
jgi:ABC-type multidrug transport system ATPase subunit